MYKTHKPLTYWWLLLNILTSSPKRKKSMSEHITNGNCIDYLDYELQFHDNHYAFKQLSTYLHMLLALTAFQVFSEQSQ